MADVVSRDGNSLPKLYHDNGDGTFSEVVYTGGGGSSSAGGEYNATPPTMVDGGTDTLQMDVNGNLKSTLATKLAGEDLTNDLLKVEHRYSYGRVVADGQIKGSAGVVHTVTFSATGTVTSGVITLYDSLTETGTVIWSGVIQTGLNPTTIVLDTVFVLGLLVGYDASIANVGTTVTCR